MTLTVIGLGYVGLPLALEFARAGCRVIGLDIDPDKIQRLQAGRCYLAHVSAADLPTLVSQDRLQPTTDFAQLRQAEAVLICVPTPITENREPDLQYIVSTSRAISQHLQRGQLIVL
ncbi:MAG: NAD(P)-binding domain-containing protein, partial [Candidatus Acidiferrales bacterium]